MLKRTLTGLGLSLAMVSNVWAQADVEPEVADEESVLLVETEFVFSAEQGAWLTTQQTTMELGYDEEAQSLIVIHPTVTLLVKDGMVSATLSGADDFVIEAPMDDLSYEALSELVPPIDSPPMVNLVMLLADDPGLALSDGQSDFVDEGDGMLSLETMDGTMELEKSEIEGLIAYASMEVGEGDDVTFFEYESHLEYLTPEEAGDIFEIDTEDREVVGSFQELITAMQMQAMGPMQGGAPAEDPMVGIFAPDFTLKELGSDEEIKLSEVEADVVLLDFWATWCPPCVEGLPKIQAVADWAEENDLSVAVFAVNLEEEADQVQGFMNKHELSMTVLMDADGSAAQLYNVTAIPTTVLIADGKIVSYFQGLEPDMENTLKQDIQENLPVEEEVEEVDSTEVLEEVEEAVEAETANEITE